MSRADLETRLDAAMAEYQTERYRSTRYWNLIDEIYTLHRRIKEIDNEAVEAAQTVQG